MSEPVGRRPTHMAPTHPSSTKVDPAYSSDGAKPTPWEDGIASLDAARISWLVTVRPEGRPHVTPLITVWDPDEARVVFCTGPQERKARNLAANPACLVLTGCNGDEGLDVVVEGEAVRITDEARLARLAGAYVDKYGPDWTFQVRDSAFVPDPAVHGDTGDVAHVFEVVPRTGFGFLRSEAAYSQTRWGFDR